MITTFNVVDRRAVVDLKVIQVRDKRKLCTPTIVSSKGKKQFLCNFNCHKIKPNGKGVDCFVTFPQQCVRILADT